MNDIHKLLLNRRHPSLASRQTIHKMAVDAYNGGQSYIDGQYLFQHEKENDYAFKKRLERSIYLNHSRPLLNTIIGFVFSKQIKRNLSDSLKHYENRINVSNTLDSFVNKIAVQSTLYTVAILIDTPSFDPEVIKTQKDREDNNLFPYAKLYTPETIRDYAYDSNGKLCWVILDDSFVNSSNPLNETENVIIRSLWTPTNCTKYFYKEVKDNNETKIEFDREEITEHNLGEVPIIFTSFKDIDDSTLFESSFAEDIIMIDNRLYNVLSLCDNTLGFSSIRPLLYPVFEGEALPTSLSEAGKLGSCVVIPFNGASSHTPYFLEASNTAIDSYIAYMNLLISEIRQIVGLNQDNDLHGVSGIAKSKEVQKIQTLLKQGSKNLERCENEIFRLISLWEKQSYENCIEYNHNYVEEDLNDLIKNMMDITTLSSDTLKVKAITKIAKRAFEDITPEEIEQIQAEIIDEPTEDMSIENESSIGLKPIKNIKLAELTTANNSHDDLKGE